jgi:transcriptional regulator with XRE-family HTH domain
MDIGTKIKVLRAKKGLNQQQLAELINKTRTLISHIEITSKVNFYTLNEIAKALDVSVSYFTENGKNSLLEEPENEYISLNDKVEKLEREIELLNEIISNQKELIKELKDKVQK